MDDLYVLVGNANINDV
ncbi:hypothetical protein [Gilliamella sp. Choc6-1]